MPLFRIHMADGRKIEVTAATPKDATPKDAAANVDGPIDKIKRVKEAK